MDPSERRDVQVVPPSASEVIVGEPVRHVILSSPKKQHRSSRAVVIVRLSPGFQALAESLSRFNCRFPVLDHLNDRAFLGRADRQRARNGTAERAALLRKDDHVERQQCGHELGDLRTRPIETH